MILLMDYEFERQVSLLLSMVSVEQKRLGSQNGPMVYNIAVLGWELVNESEEEGSYKEM